MEAKELRSLGVEELKGRIRQWSDELFRSRFKAESSEARDTSIFKKLRKDIARANTVISEKIKLGDLGAPEASAALGVVAVDQEPSIKSDPKAGKKAAPKKTSAAKSKE